LKIIWDSGGTAVAVSDEDMQKAQSEMAKHAGIFPSPEGAATFAALIQLLKAGIIQPDESAVLFATASGVKYI
jgi:threonine synthase